MELFSEIYGCYYTVISTILERASLGITKEEIYEILNKEAFYDTSFHILPKLFSEWDFLHQNNDKYYSKLNFTDFKRPLSTLEKSWIKALLYDKRILLFIDKSEVNQLLDALKDVEPLFYEKDFHIFDMAKDGDDYDDENYRHNFKLILKSCKVNNPLSIEYQNSKNKISRNVFIPWKICYSKKDDKFRLLSEIVYENRQEKATLNLSRIKNVEIINNHLFSLKNLHKKPNKNEPILLEIKEERNALERCMLQFSSWEKQTEFDEGKNRYITKIYYDKQDETELLIRILAFGPVVKVLGPDSFLKQITDRIINQYELIKKF